MEQEIEKITLRNGVRVFLEHDASLRSAAICLYIAAGSRHENRNQHGAAHYLEHILFRGTESRSGGDIARLTDRLGGDVNAQTTREYITLEAKVMSRMASEALELVCDLACCPTLCEKDVESERGVILEELAMCCDDADEVAWDMLYENVWKGSALSGRITGSRKDIEKMTSQTLSDFITHRFTPGNILLSVVGDFDRANVLSTVSDTLGALPEGRSLKCRPAEYTRSFAFLKWTLEQNHILLAFPAYRFGDDRQMAQSLLEEICGEGYSSRLYRRLRDELGLVYDESCSGAVHEHEGLFVVEFSCSPQNSDMAIRESVKVLSQIAENGISDDELSLAKDRLTSSAVLAEEKSENRAFGFVSDVHRYGRLISLDSYLEKLAAVTVEDVNRAAKEILDFSKASLIVVGDVKDEEHYRALLG